MANDTADTMLTTVDNPFNPFTQWDEWYAYDTASGYNTSAYLARVVRSSDELSEADQNAAIDEAIEEILEENIIGLYVKVSKNAESKTEK